MERLRYEEIGQGWGATRIVVGYEVALPGGWRGVGETLDEAKRAAVDARGTHEAKVLRLRGEAIREWDRRNPDDAPLSKEG